MDEIAEKKIRPFNATGRPATGRARDKQIVIRVTSDELEKIENKIIESGLKKQHYIIQALTKSKVVNTVGLVKVQVELKKIGVNINQIARRLNQGDRADEAMLDELKNVEAKLGEIKKLCRM